jgi:DNA-binding transcriptional LysR family regulator
MLDMTEAAVRKIDWALLQNLLFVLDAGSFRAAALSSGRSLNTIRTRVDALEHMTGLVLIDRNVRGAKATDAGQAIVVAARAMEAALQSSQMMD